MKQVEHLLDVSAKTGAPIATWRDFRTTAATELAFCGMSLQDIKRRLGHVSSITTEQYYVKAIPPDGGACSSVANAEVRGMEFFNKPFILRAGFPPYLDTNIWDSYLLFWFVEEVKIRFVLEMRAAGHSRKEVEQKMFPEWIDKFMAPRLEKAISHADIMRAEWEKTMGRKAGGLEDLPDLGKRWEGKALDEESNENCDDEDGAA